jgi:hypothetical protein
MKHFYYIYSISISWLSYTTEHFLHLIYISIFQMLKNVKFFYENFD